MYMRLLIRSSLRVVPVVLRRNMTTFNYPVARKDNIVDTHHNVQVPDPYRWLEDPDSEETKKFVEDQNVITRPYLDDYVHRNYLMKRLKDIWDYPKYSCPFKHGNNYFFYKNLGLQNQSILYIQENSLDSEPKVFLDPNTLSKDGTVSLSSTKFSEDGKIFAYGLSKSGSDWVSIHFKNVETGYEYEDVLEKVKFSSIAWTHDNVGIFYGRYEQLGKTDGSETDQNHNQKLYYHRIGTTQDQDVLVAEFPEEPEFRIGAEVSDDGRWLILSPVKGCKNNLIYFGDLSLENEINRKIPLIPMVEQLTADYEYITNIQGTNTAVFRTNRNAPNYRLISVDLLNPEESNWETLIPEHNRDVLDWACAINNDKLVVCHIRDVKSALHLYSIPSGKMLCEFPLNIGCITGFGGKKFQNEFFFTFTSFLNPGIIYRVDLNKEPYKAEVHMEIKVRNFDPDAFECKQIFYKSKDETEIPMFLVYRKEKKQENTRPCLLYGYGGFNVSIQPTFSLTRIVFIESFDGILAIPNIRGGGEYGENWHNAGRFFNKQNVFDDFQYAAKYLIDNHYTCSDKLTIQGGSNGGLLVGACINQAPELFKAAVAQVGVMDMLRFHKFTIGYAWISDYGCAEEEKHFKNLFSYSPLHNVAPRKDIQYPATLLLTADHDDRVVPLHSLKFIAELQSKLSNEPHQINPLLIRVETKAGHGRGKPTSKVIEEAVDILCFIGRACELPFYPNNINCGDFSKGDSAEAEKSLIDSNQI